MSFPVLNLHPTSAYSVPPTTMSCYHVLQVFPPVRGLEFVLTDRVCALLTVCGPAGHEYESVPPTPTSDRQCSPVTRCDAAKEYESRAPDASQDRACLPLSPPCAAGEAETVPASPTSDRVCGPEAVLAGVIRLTGVTMADIAPPAVQAIFGRAVASVVTAQVPGLPAPGLSPSKVR